MKKQTAKYLKVLLMAVIGFGLTASVMAADAVEPASTNIINVRGEESTVIGGSYYVDSSLLFTNCYCLVGGTGSNTQGLDGVEVELTVGNSSSNVAYTGNVYAVGGVTNRWWYTITVPDISGTMNLQTKLTDANTNIFIYPWRRLTYKDAL